MKASTGRAGFSLVEMIISLAITSILVGTLVQGSRATQKLSSTSLTLGRLEEAASQAALQVAVDIRWAQPDTMFITTENGSDRVDLMIAEGYDGAETTWSTPVIFRYEPVAVDVNENGAADEGELVRIQDGSRRVICRNVELGSFSVVRDGGRVQIQLTVTGLSSNDELLERDVQLSTTLIN